eukprot:s3589_g13.t1
MPPKKFFKGITFALSGKLAQTQKAYEELIRRHGGEVSSTVTTSVQFLVSTDEDVKANSQKVALAKGRGTPIVQEGFLGCCIAAKSLLDHCTFLIKASDPAKKREVPKASTSPAKKARLAKDEAERGSSAASSASVAYATTEAPVIAKSGLGGKAAVVQEQAKKGLMMKGTLTWDVELVLNDPAKGTDKYYNMQLLASIDGSEFWAVQHWGWTGLDGRVHVDGPFKELQAAKAVFRRKYRQKTGNVWGQLGMTFEELPGKYRLVSLEPSGSGHAKGRWQFYMHNAIDGKEVGWYDYDVTAAERLEKYWRQCCDHPDLKLGVRVIHSDYFAYEINFNELWQTNIKTGTRRAIRRFTDGEVPLDTPPHRIPEPAAPAKVPDVKDDSAEDAYCRTVPLAFAMAGNSKRRHAKVGCCFWSRPADAGRDDCESDQGMGDDLSTENLLSEAPNETQPDLKPEDSEVLTASGDWSTEASLLAWPRLQLQAASRFVNACLIKRELADDPDKVPKLPASISEMEATADRQAVVQLIQNRWLWIRDGEQVTERSLLPVEQLHVQGFPSRDPQLAKALLGLRDQEVTTGAGNAMSVPVIGSVLADIFVKTLVGRLDAAMEVSDSEDVDGESSQGPTFPRFRCGCWLHLRSLPQGPGGAMGDVCVHSGRRSQKLVLGRDPRRASALLLEADRLQETSVISRVHAELIPGSQPGEAFVRDLGSTNGSWILGRGRICPQNVEMEVLCCGDELSLGVDPSTWQEGIDTKGSGHGNQNYRFLYRVEMPTKRRRTETAETPSPAPEAEELEQEQDPEPPANEESVFPSAAAAIAALESLENER